LSIESNVDVEQHSSGALRVLLVCVAVAVLGLALGAPAGAQAPEPIGPSAPPAPEPIGPSTPPAPAPLSPSQPRDPIPRPMQPLTPSTRRVEMTVMSYNINSLGSVAGVFKPLHYPEGVTNASRDARSAKIIEQSLADVVIVDEAFDQPALDMAASLKDVYPYQTPVVGRSCPDKDDRDQAGWNGTYGDCKNGLAFIRGGTMILSKLPILESWQYIFKNRASIWMPGIGTAWTDGMANKGVALVALRAPGGGVVWVAGTHLQSGDSANGRLEKIRMQQLQEMHDFIAQRANYTEEAVLLAGDLNIPIYHDGLDHYGGKLPLLLSDPFTFNLFTTLKTSFNGVSVNCKTNRIACDSQGFAYDPPDYEDSLDYVGYVGAGKQGCCVEPVDMKSPWTLLPPPTYDGSPSDHYPVASTFTLQFKSVTNPSRRKK
jgi:endonuclease/exonuclease/phosphatase family metal-dependent hydrolase